MWITIETIVLLVADIYFTAQDHWSTSQITSILPVNTPPCETSMMGVKINK